MGSELQSLRGFNTDASEIIIL